MIVKHTKVSSVQHSELNDIQKRLVKKYEYLGMLLDDRLSMNEYVDEMYKKANSKKIYF